MKRDRYGRAKILTVEEFSRLMFEGFPASQSTHARNRALFATCFFTACRIHEAVTLWRADVYDRRGQVRESILFRKENTKGKLQTREIPVTEDLRRLLAAYSPPEGKFAFANGQGGHLSEDYAAVLLRRACRRLGMEGVSTHSFRRTSLTAMSNNGIPLRVIQQVSGHRNLEQLHAYLEVTPEQVRGAVSGLSVMAPVPQLESGERVDDREKGVCRSALILKD
jgi:integrase/recombinase XerD